MSNGSKKKLLNFRVTDAEFAILTDYCERTGRTQTDVVREIIRELAQRPTLAPQRVTTTRQPARTKPKAAVMRVARKSA